MAADVKFEVVRTALSTATAGNTQDFTISGFGTPKAAIVIVSGASADDTITAHAFQSIGFTDGTTEAQQSILIEDGVSTTDAASAGGSDALIRLPNQTGTSIVSAMSFNSWVTDGIRLDIDVQFSTAYLCTVVLIGGTDVSNAYVHHGHLNNPGTTPVDMTMFGFEPDLVFGMVSFTGSSPTTGFSTLGVISLGAAINDGADAQRNISGLYYQTGVGTTNVATAISNTYIYSNSTFGNISYNIGISDFDASGFTLTATDGGPGFQRFGWLALKFTNSPDLDLFDMTIPTSGSYAETTPGFAPSFGLIATDIGPTVRDTHVTTNTLGRGITVFDDSTLITNNLTAYDAQTSQVSKSHSDDRFHLIGADGSTSAAIASGYAFDSAGWDFTLTTNPGSAILGWGLAIGQNAATAISITDVDSDESIYDGQTGVVITLAGTWAASGKKVFLVQGSTWVEQSVTSENATSATITVSYSGLTAGETTTLYVRNPL